MSFEEPEGAPSHDGCVDVRVCGRMWVGREVEEVGENGVKRGRGRVAPLFLEENLEYARNMFRSLHFASNACASLLNEQDHQTTQRLQRQRRAHGDFSDTDMFNAPTPQPANRSTCPPTDSTCFT